MRVINEFQVIVYKRYAVDGWEILLTKFQASNPNALPQKIRENST